MRTQMAILCSVAAILAMTCTGNSQEPAAKTALKGFDPVELVAGKEAKGNEGLAVVRGLYRYLFLNADNKQKFEKNPEQYAIQMGGACARMGPLSGLGSPDRYLVHAGRIYIFASDQCRSAFESKPELFVDENDAPLKPSPEQAKRGAELLAKVIDGFGGQQAVDDVKSLRIVTKLTYKQGDKDVVGVRTVTMAFPGSFREEERWDGSTYGHALTPKGGIRFTLSQGKPDSSYFTEDSVTAFMRKDFHRFPFAMVKAKNEQGFIAAAARSDTVDGKKVEKLSLYLHGGVTTLSVDMSDGRVLSSQFRGRHGSNAIADVVYTFSDYRKVEGVLLPFGVQTTINGKSVTSPLLSTESVVVNGPMDKGLFQGPK